MKGKEHQIINKLKYENFAENFLGKINAYLAAHEHFSTN